MRTALKTPMAFWLYLLFAWSLYRYFFRFSESLDELVFKPLLWLGPVLVLVKIWEQRSLTTIGWTLSNLFQNLYLGWGLGAFYALAGIVTNSYKYHGLTFMPIGITSLDLLWLIVLSIATAFIEETIFRGYILTRLENTFNKPIYANLGAALLFSLIHLPITLFLLKPDFITMAAYLILMFAQGVGNGMIFQQRKSILAPTVSHVLWNMTVVLFR